MRNLRIVLAILFSALAAELVWLALTAAATATIASTGPQTTTVAITPAKLTAATTPPTTSATAFPATTGAPFVIRWGLVNELPFHIQSGPEQNQGFCDVVVERLRVYLADVRHDTVAGVPEQLRQQLYAGDNLCLPCSIHQQNNPGRLYSKPTHFMQTHGVIIRAADEQRFKQQFGAPVQLEKLLQSELKFARPLSRRYGPLQSLLERYQQQHQLVGSDQLAQPSLDMLRLLTQGKVDYVIDYISTLRYFRRQDRAELRFLPLADVPRWLPAAVSCPDTNWGQLAILRVNAAIDKIRHDRKLHQSLQQWFSAELPSYPGDNAATENSAAKP